MQQGLTAGDLEAVIETLTDKVIGEASEPFENLTDIGAALSAVLTGAQSYG